MANKKPCRFTNAELKALQQHLPATEIRIVDKLAYYINTPLNALYREDKELRQLKYDNNNARKAENNKSV